MDPYTIIDEIYSGHDELRRLLIIHSANVARKALDALETSGIAADERFIYEAAMLHDIGIIETDAPDILCNGSQPYIRHGLIGAEMLDSRGLTMHARVCEHHTGAGLNADDIHRQNLPLPPRDFCPVTIEEKAICYADKFFSKSGDPNREKSFEQVVHSMERHGADTLKRFLALHSLFRPR